MFAMSKRKFSFSGQNLNYEGIAKMYNYRILSLKLFFSKSNPEFLIFFFGKSKKEIDDELNYQLEEIERDACFNLLAAIEAAFRIDYVVRCERKDKSDLSRKFRLLFADYQYKLPLEDVIFEEWKKIDVTNKSLISYLKGAFKYRHWLAHGRYRTLKAGKKKYDFYELYQLATQVNTIGLLKV